MSDQLNRALDALQQADAAGNVEDARQLADLVRTLQAEESKSSVEVRGATDADLVNPLYGTVGGAFAGQAIGPAVNKGVEAVRSGAPGASSAPGAASGAAPGQKFAAKTGYGSGTGYTVEEVVEHKKAQEKPIGKGKISSKIAGNSPMNVDRMLQLEAAKKAEDARRAAALAPTGLMSKMPEPVQAAGRFMGGAAQSGVTPYLGRAVAGAGAGYQGLDMYNRFQQGDYPGAAISGLGALGSAASFVPTPVTRFGGAAVGVGAEMLNMYLDSLKKKVEGMQQPAAAPAPVQGPLSQVAPQGMAEGGDVKLPGKAGKIAKIAKKLSSGYLHNTAINPNPLVGTRFEVKDLGGLSPVKPMQLEDIRGQMIHTKPWDLSSRNKEIVSVSGKPLTTKIVTHGGQGYPRDIEHMAQDIGGASAFPISNRTQTITDIASREGEKLGGTGQVTMTPSTMSRFSEDYAIPTFDTYKNLWDQAEPGAARTQALLQRLKYADPKTLKSETPIPFAGMVKDVKYPFQDLKSLDFNDPDVMDRFLRVPDLRKAMIKDLRSKENQKMMGYNAEDLSAAHTDPDLLGIPSGYSGHTMIEMRPGSRPTLSSNITYDTDYAGKYSGSIGHTPTPVLLNKAYSKINQEMRALHPNANEDALHRLTMGALYTRNEGVSDLVNDEMINRVGAYHEGVKQNKIDPKDLKGALQFLSKPGAYNEGGLV